MLWKECRSSCHISLSPIQLAIPRLEVRASRQIHLYLTSHHAFQILNNVRFMLHNPHMRLKRNQRFQMSIKAGVEMTKAFLAPRFCSNIFHMFVSFLGTRPFLTIPWLHWITCLKWIFHEANYCRKLPKLCPRRSKCWQSPVVNQALRRKLWNCRAHLSHLRPLSPATALRGQLLQMLSSQCI